MSARAGGARPLDDERRAAWLFLSPTLLFLAGLAIVPLVYVAWLSLHRSMPVFDVSRFVGLENYRFLLRDPRFAAALRNTAYVTAVSVALEVVLGYAIALVLHRRFPGRGIARATALVPWALPTVVAAWLWEWILNPGFGILNHLLGLRVSWIGDPVWAIHAVILADVWKSTPFAALLLLAGLQVIPADLYRAARVDGAGPVRTFFRITLPLSLPTLLVVLLFRTLDAFRIFDVVWVLTGGGPANTTETLSVYGYKLYFQTLQFGYGSAVAMATFVLMAVVAGVYVLLLRRRAT